MSAKEVFYKNGGHLEYWNKNLATLRSFIDERSISATNFYASSAGAVVEHTTPKTPPPQLLKPPGGVMEEHVHVDDKIYLLNEKQWAELRDMIIADCKAKLAKPNRIGFAEAMLLESVLEG